jgi:hypothetical protein
VRRAASAVARSRVAFSADRRGATPRLVDNRLSRDDLLVGDPSLFIAASSEQAHARLPGAFARGFQSSHVGIQIVAGELADDLVFRNPLALAHGERANHAIGRRFHFDILRAAFDASLRRGDHGEARRMR